MTVVTINSIIDLTYNTDKGAIKTKEVLTNCLYYLMFVICVAKTPKFGLTTCILVFLEFITNYGLIILTCNLGLLHYLSTHIT